MDIKYFIARPQQIAQIQKKEKLISNIESSNKIDDYIKYICEDENGIIPEPNYDYDDQIIITITSWIKRINNVKLVLESILNNSMLPAKIVINLAIEEFLNKEKDLPSDLLEFIKQNKIIEINWVKHNTLVWKKTIPTLLKYPNALILCIDDDFIYPQNFIETFYNKHKELLNIPLVGQIFKIFNDYNQHSGCSTLDSFKFIKNYIKILDKEIYELGDEDTFMTYCYKRAGIHLEYVGQLYGSNMKQIQENNMSYTQSHHIHTKSNFNIISKKYDKINLDYLNTNTYEILTNTIKNKKNYNELIKIINNIQIEKHFNKHNKCYCVLGSILNNEGIKIEQEMLNWLSQKYDVISIKQLKPYNLFEYPGILFALKLSIDSNENVLYLHTKGAYNQGFYQSHIRNLWKDEFINHYDDYIKLLTNNKNAIACPFTGSYKWTWYNGFFISPAAINNFTLKQDSNRYYYETLFQNEKNINVIGRIYNDIDNKNNSNNDSKIKMRKYIIDHYSNFSEKEILQYYDKYLNPIKQNIHMPYTCDKIITDKENPIIVSFTTWKKRLPYLEEFVNNLTKQTYPIDKYIMWVSSDEIQNDEIPESVRLNKKLEIHWVDKNLKSFKKFLSIQQYPNAYNIILDDDRLYSSKTVEFLMTASKNNSPDTIIGYYTDTCNSKGQPWGNVQGNDKTIYRWINDSCVLYQPNTFPMKAFNDFMDVMYNEELVSDECFLMPYLIYNKAKIFSISKGITGLNAIAPFMNCANDNNALHNMFFINKNDFSTNKKNDLIKRILLKLDNKYLNSWKECFKNLQI